MKWYAYVETDDTYTMILDYNTTARVNSWSAASTQLTSDTTGWTGSPRLITGQEIADITGNTSWTSTSYSSSAVWGVRYGGNLYSNGVSISNGGVRPVITISKSSL